MAQPNRYRTRRGTYGNLAYAEPAQAPQRNGSEVAQPRPKVRPREKAVARPQIQVREKGHVSPFGVVGFVAVGVFAVLLLNSYAELTVATDSVVHLKQELSDLDTERTKLLAKYELAYDLSTVETKVAADGTMVKPQSSQIYTINLMEDDSVLRYEDQPTVDQPDLLSRGSEMLDTLGSYFG